MKRRRKEPDWPPPGKTIRQLIKEFLTFDNLDAEVRLSVDDGMSHHPISFVCLRDRKYCVLENAEGDDVVRKRQMRKSRKSTRKQAKNPNQAEEATARKLAEPHR